MDPMMNAPTSGIFSTSGAQDYPPVGSGPAISNKGGMPFEQHSQQQIMQSQHISSGMQQLPYGHQQQHQVMIQGPNMYQVILLVLNFLVICKMQRIEERLLRMIFF